MPPLPPPNASLIMCMFSNDIHWAFNLSLQKKKIPQDKNVNIDNSCCPYCTGVPLQPTESELKLPIYTLCV